MLNPPILGQDRVTTAHRAKLAYIYVRQSTLGQVHQNPESTELQYRLVDRALMLGWPSQRVLVIDEDLGRSGASSEARQGFQRLIAEIGLGKAGLVLSLDASRLARNNRDWHQLLELCSLFGVLLADGERLFDPGAYHDRLLLGLSGIMSEAELHQIRIRLHQGEQQRAARSELRLPLPAGLAEGSDGGVILMPDEEVQARLKLVFAKFAEFRSAGAVVRYLRRNSLMLPVRPLRGPAPQAVLWRPANRSRVLHILKNPAYAGAYVYGRRRQDPGHRRPGARRCGTVAVPPEQWAVCLQDAHPGYLSWGEFMANQRQLSDNGTCYAANHPGLPRKGRALLQGIAVCGRCGRRMSLGYSGPMGIARCTGVPPTRCSVAGRAARRCARFRLMPRSSGWCWPRWHPTRWRWPSPHWPDWRRKPVCWGANGRSNVSVPATRPSARAGNMMPSSRKTAWSRARWNAPGKTGCAGKSRSNRTMSVGAMTSRGR